jgi:hypothetical protein
MKRGQSLKSHQLFATWYGQTDLFTVEFMRISNYMRLFEDSNARNAIPKKGVASLNLGAKRERRDVFISRSLFTFCNQSDLARSPISESTIN